jgi:ubiquitin-conjugating enzyme E2 variant
LGPNERFYELKMVVGQNYPQEPPQIKFVSKINLAGVNQKNGTIDNQYFSVLKNWTKNNTLQDALKGIRKEMESSAFKKLSQPEEGSVF